MIQGGVPLPVVQRLGHENINTTIKAYCDVDGSTMRAATDVIGAVLK
jgi:site-specific recombinase XerD